MAQKAQKISPAKAKKMLEEEKKRTPAQKRWLGWQAGGAKKPRARNIG